MSNTKKTSYKEVVQQLQSFRDDRGWNKIAPVDIAKSIVIEAAELLEHYQWDTTITQTQNNLPEKNAQEIAFEAADIFLNILEFCHQNKINLLEAAIQKINHNSKKYPAKKMKEGGTEAYYQAKKTSQKK